MDDEGTSRFSDRLQAETYRNEEPVAIGINGENSGIVWMAQMPEALFARCMHLGQAYSLHYLPHVDVYSRTGFNKEQAAGLLAEFIFIRERVNDSLLDEHLERWIEVVRDYIRHPHVKAQLVIEGP